MYQRQRIPAPTPPGYTPAPTPQVYQRQRIPTNQAPPGYPPANYPPPDVYRIPGQRRPARRRRSSCLLPGCLALILVMVCLGITAAGYLLFPGRTNLLVFGVDYVDPAIVGTQARSDTIILATVDPVNSYIGLLSVPRDLWVPIPGFGENRINTAHFFAETQQPGNGPGVLLETVRQNFGIPVEYFLRLRFEGFRGVVDAMDGVDLELEKPMAGYPAGMHHLKARKALAFVRDRSGSDDFFRMEQGQVMLKSIIKTMSKPEKWPRIPAVLSAALKMVNTNLPAWMWPRMVMSFLWVGPDGIDSRFINRDMVTPFTTDQGAQVLLPNWGLINPLVREMFQR